MRFPLDIHIYLWFISGDTRLPTGWRDSIRDADHAMYLSVVSLWEALVRYRLGKLPLPHLPESYLPMLVCQALEHGLGIVTVDPVFGAYPAPILERTLPQDEPDWYSDALHTSR